MSDLITNVNRTVTDFESIKQAIIDKGIDVPWGTITSQYSKLIKEIQGNNNSGSAIIAFEVLLSEPCVTLATDKIYE